MSVLKADILAFVNEKQRLSETVASIEDEINEVLQELGKRALWPNLYRDDVTADRSTLTTGQTAVAFPAGLRVLDFIVINDGSNDGRPLRSMTAAQWQRKRRDEASGAYAEPKRYARRGKTWKPDPLPDSANTYTAKYWYWRHHPKTSGVTEDILFDDEFDLCLKYGVCAKVALTSNRTEYIKQWTPRYREQIAELLPTADRKITVCKFRDL